MRSTRLVRLATRGSELALVQTKKVAALLSEVVGVDSELVVVESTGDRDKTTAIAEFAERGIFTAEVDRAVQDGRADVSVHSAKDLPSSGLGENISLVSIPERADVRDALVGTRLSDIAQGGLIATGAIRRRVQLLHQRPDICFTDVRGNIFTRLTKIPEMGALVVALAALSRLGVADRATEILSTELMLPQVGQGAIALCCRSDDEQMRSVTRSIDDPIAGRAVRAERSFLARVGGGCDAPLAAYATVDADGLITIDGLVASIDGSVLVRKRAVGQMSDEVGVDLYDELSADAAGALLLSRGASGHEQT